MNKQPRPGSQAGFTLVEVIVSLAILSVLLIAFSSLLLQGRTTMADTADFDRRLGRITAFMEGSVVPEDVLMEAGESQALTLRFHDNTKTIHITRDEDGNLLTDDERLNGHVESFRDSQGKIVLRRFVLDAPEAEEEDGGEDDASASDDETN